MIPQPFSLDTNLKTTTSPLTTAFLDRYLATRGNGTLSGIGPAVAAAAGLLKINASYIAAHAILESSWGRSRIAHEKHNLFGWSAFTKTPYASAKAFPSFNACILFVMLEIDALYLTPGGRFFRLAPCLGHRGPDAYGMNANYASDPNWGAKIATIATQLESAFRKNA